MIESDYLRNSIKSIGIEPEDEKLAKLNTFYEMLIEKNKVMNLTTITEYKEVVKKHFTDSLTICRVKSFNGTGSMIDIGTGAGFPGIPIKIMYPAMKITLLDSLGKRVAFLNDIINELELKDIVAIHGRAEENARKEGFREAFDFATSRAVAQLNTLCEYCIPYIKTGGYFIAYKSVNIEEELENGKKAAMILGAKLEKCDKFALPETDIERALLVFKKHNSTNNKYPRAGGKPIKQALS